MTGVAPCLLPSVRAHTSETDPSPEWAMDVNWRSHKAWAMLFVLGNQSFTALFARCEDATQVTCEYSARSSELCT